jgi:hypothetical protein
MQPSVKIGAHILYKCGFTTRIWNEVLSWCGFIISLDFLGKRNIGRCLVDKSYLRSDGGDEHASLLGILEEVERKGLSTPLVYRGHSDR